MRHAGHSTCTSSTCVGSSVSRFGDRPAVVRLVEGDQPLLQPLRVLPTARGAVSTRAGAGERPRTARLHTLPVRCRSCHGSEAQTQVFQVANRPSPRTVGRPTALWRSWRKAQTRAYRRDRRLALADLRRCASRPRCRAWLGRLLLLLGYGFPQRRGGCPGCTRGHPSVGPPRAPRCHRRVLRLSPPDGPDTTNRDGLVGVARTECRS